MSSVSVVIPALNEEKNIAATLAAIRASPVVHADETGWREGGETHFRIDIVSEAFIGKSRIARHRDPQAAVRARLAHAQRDAARGARVGAPEAEVRGVLAHPVQRRTAVRVPARAHRDVVGRRLLALALDRRNSGFEPIVPVLPRLR